MPFLQSKLQLPQRRYFTQLLLRHNDFDLVNLQVIKKITLQEDMTSVSRNNQSFCLNLHLTQNRTVEFPRDCREPKGSKHFAFLLLLLVLLLVLIYSVLHIEVISYFHTYALKSLFTILDVLSSNIFQFTPFQK